MGRIFAIGLLLSFGGGSACTNELGELATTTTDRDHRPRTHAAARSNPNDN